MKTQPEKLYKEIERVNNCTLCEFSCDKSSSLISHYKYHVDESPFECPDCADLYEDLEMYQNHIESHTVPKEEESAYDYEYEMDDYDDLHNMEDKKYEETPCIDLDLAKLGVKILYSCPVCQEQFTNLNEFNQHTDKNHKMKTKTTSSMKNTEKPKRKRAPVSLAWQKHDNKVRNFYCKMCDRSFTLASTLSLHFRRTHLGIKPYECTVCEWTFAQSSDLNKHMRKHTGERPYKCEVCELTFTQKRNLKNHQKMHTNAPSKCSYCNKQFLLDTSLVQHLKKHEGIDTQPCKTCGIPYNGGAAMTSHVKREHRNVEMAIETTVKEKLNKCDECGKMFLKKYDLVKHRRIHTGERPYTCSTCHKQFGHPTSLRNHQAVHSGLRPFQCSICGQAFSFFGNLKVHMRSHTGERPYMCDICQKAFARTANLKEHIKIHTGEKSYKCEVCQKSFTNSSTFSKHKKIHTGEKPHRCTLCNKAFIQLAHLTKHIRSHTGERPYICTICKKYFRRSDTLANHLKIHKNRESTTNIHSSESKEKLETHQQSLSIIGQITPHILYTIKTPPDDTELVQKPLTAPHLNDNEPTHFIITQL